MTIALGAGASNPLAVARVGILPVPRLIADSLHRICQGRLHETLQGVPDYESSIRR